MLSLNDYSALRDYELNKLPAMIAKAEQHRLLVEAGLIRRRAPRAPSVWLSCQICRSLWGLGHLLVTTGQRLERRYAATALRPAAS